MSPTSDRVCRFCGETAADVLVEDFNPGEQPFVYCHPWCTGAEPTDRGDCDRTPTSPEATA